MFRECFALEKIHGTSAHITFKGVDKEIMFFAGGAKHESFVALFDQATLLAKYKETFAGMPDEVTFYGEAYGGKMQGMSETYGKDLKFVVFDVQIGEAWLAVPQAEALAKTFNLDFVPYEKILATVEEMDKQRDKPSVQAVKNGIVEPRTREGVVLRPIVEMVTNRKERIIVKHKHEKFAERVSPKQNMDPETIAKMDSAQLIAEEWVTFNRITNMFSHFPPEKIGMENMGELIKYMIDDVYLEAKGEIADTKEIRKAIGKKTASLLNQHFRKALYEKRVQEGIAAQTPIPTVTNGN